MSSGFEVFDGLIVSNSLVTVQWLRTGLFCLDTAHRSESTSVLIDRKQHVVLVNVFRIMLPISL